jgi:sugar diacid utilization regulator
LIQTENFKLLITPILVQKEIFGYCAFVYDETVEHKPDEDYMFLDRFSTAASLLLLNEKTKFDSFERMKGNFLDQIIEAKLSASEIVNRGKYTGIDLGQAYYVIVMSNKMKDTTMEEEFLLHEQILETTFRYFNEKKQNILVSQRDGNIILFITKDTVKKYTIYEVIRGFHSYLSQKWPKGDFLFGISNEGTDVEDASKSYEEATIALRLATSKKIVSFHSLGIVGVLINSRNIKGIKMVAEHELGPLYSKQDRELLKTLYFFLLNGGKLEQTMSDLSLSMSGLRHRIKKIESLLGKDLRDPIMTHHLFLILESLIAIGELDID